MPDPTTDLTAVTGAYPLDIDGDGVIDLVVLRVGENVLLRGLGDCRFERANEALGVRRRRRLDDRLQRHLGEPDADPADAGVRRLPDARRPTASRTTTAPTTSSSARPPTAPTYAPADRAAPELVHAVDAVQRLGSLRPARPAGLERPPLLPRTARSSSGGSSPGSRPALYTPDEGWQTLQIWGMGIASQDLTGDGYPEVYLTSQGDNKLQTLADGPAAAAYEDIALRRGATAHRPFAGGDALPSTAWHPEFEDVNNDGFIDLFVTKGNVEAQPDYADEGPEQPAHRPARRHVRRGRRGGRHRRLRRGRGAALVDLNLDGLLDLVQVVRRENVRLWRNVGTRRRRQRRRRWATGSAVDLDQDAAEPRRDRRLDRGPGRRPRRSSAS